MAATVPPNMTDYLTFIRTVMGIPVEALPDDAPIIAQSFALAMAQVNPALMYVDGVPIGAVPLVFTFGAQVGQPPPADDGS